MSGRYRTIVADPPWDYGTDHRSPSIWRRGGEEVRQKKQFSYASMSLAEIKALILPACDDARLFLWTTNRYLPSSFAVLDAWGFAYRQTIVWRKTGNPSPFGGSVAPNHAEFLLVAIRGTPPVLARLSGSVIDARAAAVSGTHSAKPECFLDAIERVSPGPYLEMFARRQRLGWDTWGNEALNHVSLASTTGASGALRDPAPGLGAGSVIDSQPSAKEPAPSTEEEGA